MEKMKKMMIATSNQHKVEEFQRMLEPYGYQVMSLLDLEKPIEIEETGTTFEENAVIKAQTIHDLLHISVIADDSGLAVTCMNGQPGIYSARFMGRDTSYEEKNRYIMQQCDQSDDRSARFVCAIAYINELHEQQVFTGVIEGEIATQACGAKGFGYDPIFYYPPFQTTLANVSEDRKNAVSHRGKAMQQLLTYMKEGS